MEQYGYGVLDSRSESHVIEWSSDTMATAGEALAACQPVDGRPIALVSGGSLSGYAAALTLATLGFSVVVVEKRSAYSRLPCWHSKKRPYFHWQIWCLTARC